MKKKIGWIILGLLVIAQFFQPSRNLGNAASPQDIMHAVPVPGNVMGILKGSCYDCHSDHTNYPWYSYITPVNWWLDNHIREGKEELNFSQFATYDEKKRAKKLEETAELVEKGKMPLNSYTWIHAQSKLNNQQRQVITDWVNAVAASGVENENH